MAISNPIQSNMTSGFRPRVNVPESEKTEQWIKDNADWCISMLPIFATNEIANQYDSYNGKRNPEQYNHITQTYGIEFPAGKLKHIPLIRPMLNELVSEMEERNLDFSVFAEDPDSVAQKVTQINDDLLNSIAMAIRSAQSPEELDMMFDQMEREFSKFQTDIEINTFNLLLNYVQRNKTERVLSENWLDSLITGLEYYRVHLTRLGEDPKLTHIQPGTLFYAENEVRTVAECDWAVHISHMTPTEIIEQFGDEMSDAQKKDLEDYMDMYHKDAFYKLRPNETMDDLLNYSNGVNNSLSNHKYTVYHVEYRSLREVKYLESPNKYSPDDPFIKLIDDTQLYKIKGSRKKAIKRRYIEDLYHCVRIGEGGPDGLYFKMGAYEFPLRSVSKPSKVRLTFNGPAYNSRIRPYSIISATNDLQDMYDILHWHKENLIALSGAKGSVMDLSQLPDFGTGKQTDNIKMYFYYRKMGAAFINRAQEGADRSYNQFSTYDDTLGAGLNAILLMIQHIEQTASRVTGVSPQRMAQIKGDAGKGTTEMNLEQSSMITEYMFNRHDEFVEYALNDVVNALRIAYPDGVKGSFISTDGKSNFYSLDDRFPASDYGVHLTTKKSDGRKIEELKQQSYLLVKSGLMAPEQMLVFFKKDSLPIILREIEEGIAKRSEAMQQAQQQQAQVEQQLAQATAQADIQKLQAQAQELQAKIQNYQAQNDLENKALEIQRSTDEGKLELDAQRVDLEAKQLQFVANSNAAEVRNS